jgi:hypothetical protein
LGSGARGLGGLGDSGAVFLGGAVVGTELGKRRGEGPETGDVVLEGRSRRSLRRHQVGQTLLGEFDLVLFVLNSVTAAHADDIGVFAGLSRGHSCDIDLGRPSLALCISQGSRRLLLGGLWSGECDTSKSIGCDLTITEE